MEAFHFSVFLYVRHKLHTQLRPIFLLQQSFLFYRQHDVIVPHIVFSKKSAQKRKHCRNLFTISAVLFCYSRISAIQLSTHIGALAR